MTGHLELGLLAAVAGDALQPPRGTLPGLLPRGLALGLVPIVPEIGLPPDLVLLIFLPPHLYSAAFFSSPRDLKANLRPIASLSIGLVVLTTITVALVAHLLVGFRGRRSFWGRWPRQPTRGGRRHSQGAWGAAAGWGHY